MNIVTKDGVSAGVLLDSASEKEILLLAGVLATVIGGPYAAVGLRILQLARTMLLDLRTDPEFIKYFESLEQLTIAYKTRHGGKTKNG